MSEQKTGPFEVEIPLPVRTYDIDFAGVVSNIVYIRWLEDLRLAVLEACYPLENLLAAGLVPTLVETRIRYLRPLRLADRPRARMRLSQIRKLKLFFSTEIHVDGQLATAAEQTACLIHTASGRPVPVPEELIKMHLEYRRPDS